MLENGSPVLVLFQVENVRGIIIVEKSNTTVQCFDDVQNFAAITLGMIVIPVSSQEEAAGLLAQMVSIHLWFVCFSQSRLMCISLSVCVLQSV